MWRSLMLAFCVGLSILGSQPVAWAEVDGQFPAESGRQGDRGLGVGAILNLINLLKGSSASTQVDLSPEVADIRRQLSRLYVLLASQYLVQDQLLPACKALEASLVTELEAYLSKRLDPVNPEQDDCFASIVTEISQRTNSPTALVFPSRTGVLVVPPAAGATTANPATLSRSQRSHWIAVHPQAFASDRPAPIGTQSRLAQESSPNQPFFRAIRNVSDQTFNDVIKAFHLNLQDAQSNAYITQAQQLYDWIIRPIEPELAAAKIETLVFVTQGGLRVIPPAAFHDGEQFLAEKICHRHGHSDAADECRRAQSHPQPSSPGHGIVRIRRRLSPAPGGKN